MSIMSASEGPAPVYTGAPEDQQPMDIRGWWAMGKSLILRDGGFSPEEQRDFMAGLNDFMLSARADQAQAQQMAAQQGAQDPNASGLGSSAAGGSSIPDRPADFNPFGGAGGVDIPGSDDPDEPM